VEAGVEGETSKTLLPSGQTWLSATGPAAGQEGQVKEERAEGEGGEEEEGTAGPETRRRMTSRSMPIN